jgi:hypothetical protein
VKRIALLFFLVVATSFASTQNWEPDLPTTLDALAKNAWQPSLLTAFGNFTFAYSDLASPFSRFLEESLASAITRSAHLQLFNREAAAAMDPAFRQIYGEYFKTNGVDAFLSGRFFDEGQTVRAHLELTNMTNGILVGTADLQVPKAAIPNDVPVEPTAAATAASTELGNLISNKEAGGLSVSVSAERGPDAVYREGEDMVVLVTVSKEAWVKVYHIYVKGKVQLIWPNRFGGGGTIKPGEAVRIPGEGAPFAFKMTPPFGTEFIKVVASTRPFATNEADFTELSGDARGVISRGLSVEGLGKAEQAEAMASYVIMQAK